MTEYELSDAALVQLVGYALENVEGVRVAGSKRRAVRVFREGEEVGIELSLVAEYGRPLEALAREVQRVVGETLLASAGVKTAYVDVNFLEVVPADAS